MSYSAAISSPDKNILICGNGAEALLAATLLDGSGHDVSLCRTPDQDGRQALLMSPAVLSKLESCGLADTFIGMGHRLNIIRIFEDEKLIGRFDLGQLKHDYNFLLAVPYDSVCRVLEERLDEHMQLFDGAVENVRFSKTDIQVHLKGERIVAPDVLVAADGGNSQVRTALGIPYVGYDYPLEWVYQDGTFEEWDGDIDLVFYRDRAMRLFVKTGERSLRVYSNVPSLERPLPAFIGAVDLKEGAERFRVYKRQAKFYSQGNVFLSGYAAHGLGPLGGIGYGCGFGDIFELSDRLRSGDFENLQAYGDMRRRCGETMLERSEMVFKAMHMNSYLQRSLRAYWLFIARAVPGFRGLVLRRIAGLDQNKESD